MIVLLSVVVLVLAAAMVVLFAMMGELASRVPAAAQPWVEELDEAQLGHATGSWPAALDQLSGQPRMVLLVLSTVCGSCRSIAADLRNHSDWGEAGVVVSTPDRESGNAFVAEFGLRALPHYVDERGAWTKAEFGVATSPAALVFDGNRLVSAYAFSDVTALRSRLETPHEAMTHVEKT